MTFKDIKKPQKALLLTLGCRLNQADSGLICSRLESLGWKVFQKDAEDAFGLIVVNSCSVTETAFQKSRQLVRRVRRRHPEALIVLTGCSADIDQSAWASEKSIDILLPNLKKAEIGEIVAKAIASEAFKLSPGGDAHDGGNVFKERACGSFPFKSRANLKVQEGCNSHCSYCVVPRARGPERSRDIEETLDDFKSLLDKGFKEIVLTGVNICAYRCGRLALDGLLERMLAVKGDFRLRLSSTEPHPVLDSILNLMASDSRICRFLHLPLQHGSDPVLKAMGRAYGAETYKAFTESARRTLPGVHLGTDLIVGFPGETEALFEESYEFVKSLRFANMHIFPFSPRHGTAAASMPGSVPQGHVKRRIERLRALKERMALDFQASHLGDALDVLIQKRRGRRYEGLSDNYLNVEIEGGDLLERSIVKVRIIEMLGDGKLRGIPVS